MVKLIGFVYSYKLFEYDTVMGTEGIKIHMSSRCHKNMKLINMTFQKKCD